MERDETLPPLDEVDECLLLLRGNARGVRVDDQRVVTRESLLRKGFRLVGVSQVDPTRREDLFKLPVPIRAGLHTGEVELRGGDVGGIAVHIGARVAALARAHEVLVSRTVKDLVADSGIEFVDRGVHTLKGVPDEWQLYAVLG